MAKKGKRKGKKVAIVNIYREHKLWLPKSLKNRAKMSEKTKSQWDRFSNFLDVWEDELENNLTRSKRYIVQLFCSSNYVTIK